MNLALFIGLLCRYFALVMGKCYQFIGFMTKNFCEKEFSSTNDTKDNLFLIFCPGHREFFQNFAVVKGPSSEFSKAHLYQSL